MAHHAARHSGRRVHGPDDEAHRTHRDTGDPAEATTRAALLAATRQSLELLSGALSRIAEGTYGLCGKCGTSISPERLEILPHARFCMPCQSSHQS
ncbi:TraR/DksA family transcriptional regulator [Actinoplanes xinjiangensis]|uniref:TraR/DksA family transcriptional regulator n=1 Tax=Actinoplanes xinjiangensis TaxID=512350 RepID=UPI0034488218